MEGRPDGIGRVASFGVGRTDDNPCEVAPADGSGAHQARLHRDVQRAVVEILSAEGGRRGRDGLYLGVRGDVGQALGKVVAAAEHSAVRGRDDGAYRHFAEGCRALYLELSDVLGIPFTEKKDELTPEQEALFNARKDARKAKNWAESDRIRDELKAQGILVEDTPQGMKWKRI